MRPNSRALANFRPLSAPRSLTHEFVARLRDDIIGQKLAPGTQLPTEQEMIAATGVSRTVVREAVAHLRAEGLVVTRQGVGAFVADTPRRPFRIALDELQSLKDVLDVMELRTGIEIEAAGLAAERASAAQLRRIETAFKAIAAAVAAGQAAAEEDFAFHHCIAEATGNPQFTRFLDHLGATLIPRRTLHAALGSPSRRRSYLEVIQREHADIVEAVRSRDVASARRVMRRHLLKSRQRYRKLSQQSPAR